MTDKKNSIISQQLVGAGSLLLGKSSQPGSNPSSQPLTRQGSQQRYSLNEQQAKNVIAQSGLREANQLSSQQQQEVDSYMRGKIQSLNKERNKLNSGGQMLVHDKYMKPGATHQQYDNISVESSQQMPLNDSVTLSNKGGKNNMSLLKKNTSRAKIQQDTISTIHPYTVGLSKFDAKLSQEEEDILKGSSILEQFEQIAMMESKREEESKYNTLDDPRLNRSSFMENQPNDGSKQLEGTHSLKPKTAQLGERQKKTVQFNEAQNMFDNNEALDGKQARLQNKFSSYRNNGGGGGGLDYQSPRVASYRQIGGSKEYFENDEDDEEYENALQSHAFREGIVQLEGNSQQSLIQKAIQDDKKVQEMIEEEEKKNAVSIDRYNMIQFAKNPISSCNMVVISITYMLAIGVSFPLSYYGVGDHSCNLKINYRFHLIYLGLIVLFLLPTDVYAFIFKERVQEILLSQSGSSTAALQSDKRQGFSRQVTLCQLLLSTVTILLYTVCTLCHVYELYSDLLVIWVSVLTARMPFAFGFFALVFPLVNRLFQVGIIIRLFILGVKMRAKTIKGSQVERLLVLIGLFNVSNLLFGSQQSDSAHHDIAGEQEPWWVPLSLIGGGAGADYYMPQKSSRDTEVAAPQRTWKIILICVVIKEIILKLLQIVLKLILITPTLSTECGDNFEVLGLMALGNLFSILHIIFFVVTRYPKENISEPETLKKFDQFKNDETQRVELVINNKNEDLVLKHLYAYILKNKRRARRLSISFQNMTKYAQPAYRQKFMKYLLKSQAENQKFKELKIYDSQLNLEDFSTLRWIISSIPKFEALTLENCEIDTNEFECIEMLKFGIERNKRFRNLTLRYKTQNKKILLDTHFKSMYNLNKQLSILYIDQSFRAPYTSTNNSSQMKDQRNFNSTNLIELNFHEEDTIYTLYNDLDLEFFIECRKQFKNHKLFLFRDWENLLRRLYLVKSRNLHMAELPGLDLDREEKEKKMSAGQISLYRRQQEMFIVWVTLQIEKNRQLGGLSLRFQDENVGQELVERNRLAINIDQASTIVDEIIANDSEYMKRLYLVYNSAKLKESISQDQLTSQFDKFSSLFTKTLKLTHLKELTLENLNLSTIPEVFSLLGRDLTLLSFLTLKNTQIRNLEGIHTLTLLESLTLTENPIRINTVKQLIFLFRKLKSLTITHHSYDQPKQQPPIIDGLQTIPLSNRSSTVKLQDDFFLDFETLDIELNNEQERIEFDRRANNLERLVLKSNKINDELLSQLMKYVKNDDVLQELDLEDNLLTDSSIDSLMHFFLSRGIDVTLRTLNISNNKFTPQVQAIMKQHMVEEIILTGNQECAIVPILDDICQKFQRDFSILTRFTLNKQKPKKGEEGPLIKIKIDLQAFQQMQSLELAYQNIDSESILQLLKNIREYKIPIHTLDLSGNNVGPVGCKWINVLAQRNKKLRSLKLDYTQIYCLGLSYIWIGFSDEEDNLQLDYLSVKGNKIDNGWARRLGYKLCSPLKVRCLDLSENRLFDSSAKDLMSYFMDNKYLQTLYMCDNDLSYIGLRQLKELIWHNSNFRELIIKDNEEIYNNAFECVSMAERRMRCKENAQKIVYF